MSVECAHLEQLYPQTPNDAEAALEALHPFENFVARSGGKYPGHVVGSEGP